MVGFLFSIPVALTSYINSTFLSAYISQQYLGIIYALASIATIVGLMHMPKILNQIGNRRTILLFSLLFFLSLALLAFGGKDFIAIPAFILYFLSINCIITSLDIFIEDFSKSSKVGLIRGTYLTIINSAWILAQIISGSIIDKSSLRGIYLLSAGFMALVSILFILFLDDFKDPRYKKVPVVKTLKLFIQNKNFSKIYLLNFILQFFYAWMVIYTPIYLHQYLGFEWSKIGIIFSIMLLPFVLLELPLGKLSDKIGEKEMLIAGFVIISISVLVIPFTTTGKLWFWALMLLITRIGAATIEVMSESYFFKVVSEEDADEISFFRNTGPVSYIIAPLLAVPTLLFVPSFEYIFFVLSAVMLCGFLISLRLRDVK